ncbi:MAG: acyltransferase [Acidimicrobiia bacterium]|nr:acyltransferase [Acidimicrobiia bacterium]
MGLGWLDRLVARGERASAADSIDVAYYGTHTRAFELLSGSLLASVMLLRRLRGVSEPSAALGDLTGAPIAMSGADTEGRAARRRRRSAGADRPLWTVLGLLGLVIMAVLWTVARQDDSRLYPLGLSVHTGATVAVLIAASRPGRLARLLSVAPARAIGRWSYGIYLYHWPVFVWLNPQQAHADGWWLFMLRCAVTVTLAALSYRFVEEPIRRGGPRHYQRVEPEVGAERCGGVDRGGLDGVHHGCRTPLDQSGRSTRRSIAGGPTAGFGAE